MQVEGFDETLVDCPNSLCDEDKSCLHGSLRKISPFSPRDEISSRAGMPR